MLNRIHRSLEIGALARCDFIVEAIFERESSEEGDAHSHRPRSPIRKRSWPSNTTTLPISDLASACSSPARFLGTHFFAPVDRMELLEIVVGEKTAPETIRPRAHAGEGA